jgi:adenylate cyclase
MAKAMRSNVARRTDRARQPFSYPARAVLARLKAGPATRDIPVIVVFANNDMPSVVKGITLGAEDYLPKPFDPVLLQVRISACLENKRLRDQKIEYLR